MVWYPCTNTSTCTPQHGRQLLESAGLEVLAVEAFSLDLGRGKTTNIRALGKKVGISDYTIDGESY